MCSDTKLWTELKKKGYRQTGNSIDPRLTRHIGDLSITVIFPPKYNYCCISVWKTRRLLTPAPCACHFTTALPVIDTKPMVEACEREAKEWNDKSRSYLEGLSRAIISA